LDRQADKMQCMVKFIIDCLIDWGSTALSYQ